MDHTDIEAPATVSHLIQLKSHGCSGSQRVSFLTGRGFGEVVRPVIPLWVEYIYIYILKQTKKEKHEEHYRHQNSMNLERIFSASVPLS